MNIGPLDLRRFVLVCVLSAIGSAGARAQSTSATLTGRVTTSDEKPVAAALIQARSDGSGAIRVATSGDDGAFRFDLLGIWNDNTVFGDGPVARIFDQRRDLFMRHVSH